MDIEIKTPQTHPDHRSVGSYFQGYNGGLYVCDSYDSRVDFWMTNVLNPQDRRAVSPRAIGSTFHELYGHVRPHHNHQPEAAYHSIDLREPYAEPLPFPYDQASTHTDPNVLVFFDWHSAKHALRALRRAVETPATT